MKAIKYLLLIMLCFYGEQIYSPLIPQHYYKIFFLST